MKGRELWRVQSPRLIVKYSQMQERLVFEQRQWAAAIQGIELEEPDWDDDQAREERKLSLARIEWLKKKLAEKRAQGKLPDLSNVEAFLKTGKGKVIGLNTETEDELKKQLKKQGVTV